MDAQIDQATVRLVKDVLSVRIEITITRIASATVVTQEALDALALAQNTLHPSPKHQQSATQS